MIFECANVGVERDLQDYRVSDWLYSNFQFHLLSYDESVAQSSI